MSAADNSSDRPVLRLALAGPQATAALAARLAQCLVPGMVIHLCGELGAGKTHLTRALLRALGCQDRVKSPTFTLLESYNLSRFQLYHFDFYRLSTERAWLDAGFDEFIGGDGVAVIEWPERAGRSLPAPDLRIRLDFDAARGEDARVASIEAGTAWGQTCLSALREAGPAPSAADPTPTRP